MSDPDFSGLRRWTCPHTEITMPDRDGYALCVRCGAAIATVLTPDLLAKTMRAVLDRKQP